MENRIRWQDIDTVLLDMDGTLLDLAYDNWFWQLEVPSRYAERVGKTLEQALPEVEAAIRGQEGTLNWYCTDFWSRQLQIDIQALKRASRERIGYRAGAEDFLRALQQSGKRNYLVTNASPDSLAIKAERTGLGQYFDAMHSSHTFGAAKEHDAFWPSLQQVIDFDPARTLMVDDSLPVLNSAQRFGIGHIWSIRQPDSSRPARAHTDPFPAIDGFHEVLPDVG